MGNVLPALNREAFNREILGLFHRLVFPFETEESQEHLEKVAMEAMWIHYKELLRWNPRLSLVGPGTGSDVLGRHFGEALAALPSLSQDGSLLDVGSGGGFPGLVLAAARPGLEVALLEPKQKKWTFLNAVIRKIRAAGLPLSCCALDARVEAPLPVMPALPDNIDTITCRALTLDSTRLRVLTQKYPGVRFLLWSSIRAAGEADGSCNERREFHKARDGVGAEGGKTDAGYDFPTPYHVVQRIPLEGSRRRYIVDMMPCKEASQSKESRK